MLKINEAEKGFFGIIGNKGRLILSMCSTMTPETIAPPPKPIPNICTVLSKERSLLACSISTIPRIELMA
jgi:hypothetical protein